MTPPPRPAHGGYPTSPAPERIRLDGRRHDPAVVQAIYAIAAEFPGDADLILDVGERSLTMPVKVERCDALTGAIVRAVRSHPRRAS